MRLNTGCLEMQDAHGLLGLCILFKVTMNEHVPDVLLPSCLKHISLSKIALLRLRVCGTAEHVSLHTGVSQLPEATPYALAALDAPSHSLRRLGCQQLAAALQVRCVSHLHCNPMLHHLSMQCLVCAIFDLCCYMSVSASVEYKSCMIWSSPAVTTLGSKVI